MNATGANEEMLRLVRDAVQAIDAGIAIVDRNHTFVWVNTWLEDRYPMFAPLVGSKCYQFMNSSGEQCDGCPITGAGDGVARTVQDMPCPASSTEFAWIEIEGTPLKDTEGHVIGAVAHFHDVTDRKAAQNAVAEETARRRALIEQSRDGIVIVDSECAVVEANAAFARMLGYTREEIASLHVWDWDVVYTPEELLRQIEEANALGEQFQTVHRRKNGSTYEVDISQNADIFGAEKYNLCICRDITERQRLDREREAALSALEEEVSRRRLLVEQSRDGIVVLDENGKVWESNEAFATMLGYSPEEMLSLHVWDWEYQFPRERLREMIDAIDSGGDHFVTAHRRKDGSTYEVEISTNGAFYGGKKYIFCVCRDITEKVRTEREREALIAKLQEALAELKTLRGIIPVCSFCKKVRDDRGYWEQVEVYIKKNSEADVSHGICPDCLSEHFPGMDARHDTTWSHEANTGQGSK